MKMKKKFGECVFDMSNGCFMCIMMAITIYPMLYVVFASFSDPVKFVSHQGLLYKPVGFSLDSYDVILKYPMLLRGYLNTIFVVVVGVLFNILATVVFAYFISNKDIMLRKLAAKFMIVTMFFSGGLIPVYLTVKAVGLLDSIWVLIIPGLVNATNVIIMRTAFDGIPDSLSDAACIDGANDFHVLFQVFVPVSISTIAVLVLYYGVRHWNSWFAASIYLRNREKFPLQLILREILLQSGSEGLSGSGGLSTNDLPQLAETIKYSTIVVATLPILMLYPFLQKYFVKGVMIGAVKG